MTRIEFLEELKESLTDKMNASEIQSHLDYYNSYINEEISRGKMESEVLDELGSPFAIAKTLLMPYESEPREYEEETNEVTRGEKLDNSARKIITIVIIIAIAVILLSLMFNILAFVIRYAVPLSVIALVVYFIKKK